MNAEKVTDDALDPAIKPEETCGQVRRHQVEELIRSLAAVKTNSANSAARVAHVVEILRFGFASGRKTIVLPVGAGLPGLEAHLGLPAYEEDEAEWCRIRREFDESREGTPATYQIAEGRA